MTTETRSGPIGELVGGLATDLSALFQKEMELARTEASEKFGSALGGVELLLVAAVIGIGAVVVLFQAIVTALSVSFVANGMGLLSANLLATLIVFVVAGVIAWALVARGRATLNASNLKLERTTTSLSRGAAAVKERF
ncbi:MAG TPA: phage holin family protein [Devosiaceae bacterium]|jgi:hypothetical protein|nr:phage holin family protein [Devosiaceae bacterium]